MVTNMMVKCEYTMCGRENLLTDLNRIHHWPCCAREITDISLQEKIAANLEAKAKPVVEEKPKAKPKAKAPAKKKAEKKSKGKK